MDSQKASLVFVLDAFGSGDGKISAFIQRGDAKTRLGPFVSPGAQRFLYDYLPPQDQLVIDVLEKNGLLNVRDVDSRVYLIPGLLQEIGRHPNLYVRTKKFGSIRRANSAERERFHRERDCDDLIPMGQVVGGYVDITDVANIRISFKYFGLNDSVPYVSEWSEEKVQILVNGEFVCARDVQAELSMLDGLSYNLGLPKSQVYKADFDGLDLSSLSLISDKKWTLMRGGAPVHPVVAKHSGSRFVWFGEGAGGDKNIFEYEDVAAAYLSGRRYIEKGNNFIVLPDVLSGDVNENIALNIASAGGAEVPISSILGIRKNFEKSELCLLSNDLKKLGFKAVLRDYQLAGVLWLFDLYKSGLGGILADEMGLGKTVQTLAFIKRAGLKKVLIVSPASVVPNWLSEIRNFTPDITSHSDVNIGFDSGLLVISYQRALIDVDLLKSINLDAVFLDEGQFVKNNSTKTAHALKKINSRFRVVLTGTPIENSANDLWSHLGFTNPFLGAVHRRLSKKIHDFGKNRAAVDLSIRAFGSLILRRTKHGVEIELPPMIDRLVYCPMSDSQRGVYERVLNSFRFMLGTGMSARVNSIALEAILRLRQSCSTPQLLPDSLNINDVRESSKIEATMRIVKDDLREGRKTVVFSQFRKVLDLLGDELARLGVGVVRLDGNTADRSQPVEQFQSNSDVRVFLVGFRAGGTGLNLTAAESVILFDPWWNPAAESQAYARAHRIGQKKTVFVSKLICPGTVEERMVDLVSRKEELMVGVSDGSKKITSEELIKLITMDG